MSYTFTTSDGNQFHVDDFGNLQHVGRAERREERRNDWILMDEAAEVGEEMFTDTTVSAAGTYSWTTTTAVNRVWIGNSDFYLSGPIENFDAITFTRISQRLGGAGALSARQRFDRILSEYNRYLQGDSSGRQAGRTVRIAMNRDGTWEYYNPGRAERNRHERAPVRLYEQRQLRPKVCLHDSCIRCQGTGMVGGRRRCVHNFDCVCIKCAD